MDDRRALAPGTILAFPGMACTLLEEIGRGSNAIVYRGTYPDLLSQGQVHTVLVKELFPYHRKAAIFRGEDGQIHRAPEGEETWALHQQSFAHGNQIHLRLLERYPDQTGANLNTYPLNGTLYTVLGYNGGRSLAEEPPTELRRLTVRLLGLLDALEAFHESGFLHLDIAPDNILLTGQGDRERVLLIDYNSVWDLAGPGPAPYASVKAGYSAPEVRTGQLPSAASDLYAVTAVFYRCLTGQALTPFQMSRPALPDVTPYLGDVPATVAGMVRQILRRGLQTLPRNRYQTVEQMRQAVQELLDRIDGVGVTHAALWESGRRTAERAARENPSLAFLRREEEQFPASVRLPDGTAAPAGAWLEALLHTGCPAALLTASGGMGKTTALLRAALGQSYAPAQPAVLYISLFGWREGDANHIHDRILEELRFKRDQRSFADARHALDQLLASPLQTRGGPRPVLVLLLDGLNEAAGETRPLVEEILALSRLPGVGLLVSTRTEEAALPFPRVELAALTGAEVEACLAQRGLLAPDSAALRELLRTPLLLSIFIQSAQAEERQIAVESQEELLETYFAALLTKELRTLPEDTEERWRIEAALDLVLPAIAGEVSRRQRALTDRELLPVVERCWRLFSSRILRRAFPQWIGHSRAIRGGAAGGEEWYGQMVHALLWKRLGLLVRDEEGRYRLSHQIVEDYLAERDREVRRRIWRWQRLRLLLSAAALVVLVLAGTAVYARYIRPAPYDSGYADTVLTCAAKAYVDAGHQYEALRALVDCALEDPADYPAQRALYQAAADFQSLDAFGGYGAEALERMLATGEVVPWSGEAMDEERCRMLLELAGERSADYEALAETLHYVMEDERARQRYGESYPEALSELIDMDADIAAILYRMVCAPHEAGRYTGSSVEAVSYQSTLTSIPVQNRHLPEETGPDKLSDELRRLQGERTSLRESLAITTPLGACRDAGR